MQILMVSDYAAMSRTAADAVGEMLKLKPEAVLGLPTGRTPVGLYRCLTEDQERGRIDLSRATTFNLDEYVGLGPDHPCSYRRFMQTHLFSRLPAGPGRHFIPDGLAADLDRECISYDRRLDAAGGLDLLILGLGTNGHIGFNEPAEALVMKTHRARLSAGTRQANSFCFSSLEAVPRESITLGLGAIMGARRILLLVSGASKRDILRQALSGTVTTQLPASLLQLHGDVRVIADAQALGRC